VNNLNSEVHASTSYLRVHSLSGDSPTALKYPSRQGHTDNPRCVLLLLAGQGRQVTFMDRYVPESQPLVGRGGEGRWGVRKKGTGGKRMDRLTKQTSNRQEHTYA